MGSGRAVDRDQRAWGEVFEGERPKAVIRGPVDVRGSPNPGVQGAPWSGDFQGLVVGPDCQDSSGASVSADEAPTGLLGELPLQLCNLVLVHPLATSHALLQLATGRCRLGRRGWLFSATRDSKHHQNAYHGQSNQLHLGSLNPCYVSWELGQVPRPNFSLTASTTSWRIPAFTFSLFPPAWPAIEATTFRSSFSISISVIASS